MSRIADDTNKQVLEERLGYIFKDQALLTEALTHKSYFYENPGQCPSHNERLEFLGDSVIALTVANHLFAHPSAMSESVMSKVKSYVVKGSVLSRIADHDLRLGEHILLGRGEIETGGRAKPSILTDCFEALVGAIYRDGGLEPARAIILRLLSGELDSSIASGDYRDYKTMLQERCQRQFAMLPTYRLSAEEGRDHEKLFTVEVWIKDEVRGIGKARSKKEAEQLAAHEALDRLQQAGK